MIDSKKPYQLNKQEMDAMTLLEIAKLVERYCQQHDVSFDVALYAIRIVVSD